MATKPINVGIVGYGFSTKCFHLPFILSNPDLRVHAVLQRAAPEDKTRWGHCTVDFPDVKHYRTPDDFFADKDTELVLVLTHDHEQFIERAIVAGKHVVTEKPFVKTSAEADRLIALAKEKKVVLTVFHNRRYDSDFRTLQQLINKDALGEVLEAEIHFDYPSPGWINGWTERYTPGEGMMFGLGTHTVDQALCLFGTPATVTAFLRANREDAGVSDIDDTFTIVLQYGGQRKNLVVFVKTAIVTPLKDQLKFFVRGRNGTYLKFGTDPQEANAIAAPGKPAASESFGTEDPGIWGTLTTKAQVDASQTLDTTTSLSGDMWVGRYPSLPGSYSGYYENVVDAIRGGALYVTPEVARDGLRVIELARVSHEKGCSMPWS